MPLFGKKEIQELASDVKPQSETFPTRSQMQIARKVPFENLEAAFMLDPLVYHIVNKVVNGIAHAPFMLESTSMSDVSALYKFFELNDLHLEELQENIVRDILVFGNAFIHKTSSNGKLTGYRYLDPKTVDFQRNSDETVITDKSGNPKGWVFQENLTAEKKLLPYEDIIHLTLWNVYSRFLGFGPLEVALESVRIKLNLERSVGEAAFRVGFPIYVAYVGDEKHRPTQEAIDSTLEIIKEIGTKTSFSLPYYTKLNVMEPKSLELQEQQQVHFDRLICGAFAYPYGLWNASGMRNENIDRLAKEWEGYLNGLRLKFGHLMEDKVFKPIGISWEFKTIPHYVWKEGTQEMALNQSRRLAALARAGLLTPEINLENFIRRLEGLPVLTSLPEKREEKFDLATFSPTELGLEELSKAFEMLTDVYQKKRNGVRCPETYSSLYAAAKRVVQEYRRRGMVMKPDSLSYFGKELYRKSLE